MVWGLNPSVGPISLCACMFIIIIIIRHEASLSSLNVMYVYVVRKTCLELTLQSPVSILARQPPVGQGLLIHEVSRSHTTTHHSR
jgi:hypothetical protein